MTEQQLRRQIQALTEQAEATARQLRALVEQLEADEPERKAVRLR